MTSKPDSDNPEWTDEMFARSKGAESLPADVLGAFKKHGGRPRGSNKQPVSLRLDRDVIAKFKATGPGWQSRINDALRRARI
jgi:uncharacterized protein (DUF4415 family)